MVIARQVEDSSCGKVLREILNAEGIVPRVPGHSSAGFTQRPGSSTVSPLATPPSVPVDRTPSTPRPWKPPTVSTPAPVPVVTRPVPPPVPVTFLPTPVVAMPPSSPPAQVPRASPKEPAPVVSEVKIESKPPIEPAAPVVPEAKVESKRAIEVPVRVPVSKPPAPEIVSKPAEAWPKDVPPTPIRQEPAKTVKEPEKPAAVVSPKVAKTHEEKKAVSKPIISPPPVEKPAFVTPKVMPAPQVPATRPRSADVEEEPQVWDARKLKPIGIGIAALLAISLSFVARTVLWPVKPRMVIAKQPSSAAPQPIAATRETAAPTIVATTESAPPALTNPASVSEAT